MRTTVDIDDDVLQAVKAIAAARGVTAGQALSQLARQALRKTHAARVRNGVPLLPVRADGRRATMKRVNELRDQHLPPPAPARTT